MRPRLRSWLLATLLVATGARAFAVPIGEIACGETHVRVLGSQPEELVFFAQKGEVVGASVVADPPADGFAPRWRIADVEGTPVGLSNGDRRCDGRCETAPLPAGGAFTLRIADSGRGRGAYVVSFEALSATANGLSNGPPAPACARTDGGRPDGTRPVIDAGPIAGTIAPRGETDTYTLDTGAGEVVRVDLTRTGGDAAFAPLWLAFDAAGRAVGQAGAGETVPLATAGAVTILVADARGAATGDYAIRIGRLPPPSSTTTVTETTTTSTTTSSLGPDTTTTTSTVSTTSIVSTTTATIATTTTTAVTSTTTPVAVIGLRSTIGAPAVGPASGLGSALAATAERLVVGAPHAGEGSRRRGTRNAGTVLVVDVAGTVGSPGFGQVVGRLASPTPGWDGGFGAAVATAGPRVLVGAPGGRAAFLFVAPFEEEPRVLVPPGAAPGDEFGAAVAIANDLLVVGAPNAAGGGAAYVFEPGASAPRVVLKAPAGAPVVRFGAALASAGDLVLVGAPGDATHPGRAFLFTAATGMLVKSFVAESAAAGDGFGAALAFDGEDPVIGAPGTQAGRGAACRFDVATGRATLCFARPDPAPGERFGAALAVGDGHVVAGAPQWVHADVAAGAAFAFDADTAVVDAALHKAMPERSDSLGAAVAAAGGRIFVGAPGDDVGTTDGGSVRVYEGGMLVAVLRERLSTEEFGAAVAGRGGQLFAGAPAGGPDGRGWIAPVDPAADDVEPIEPPEARARRFGGALASVGATVAVGAPETNTDAGERVGVVYLYDGPVLQATIEHPEPAAGDEFGFAVGRLGGDVLASAPFAGEGDAGRVYRMAPGNGKLRVTYAKPAPTAGDLFGAAVAGDAGQVLVGAPFDAGGGEPAGGVYLFDADSAAIVRAIPNPNGTPDAFGAAVALGDWIVVGAPLADDATIGGAVWVFDRATGSILRRVDNPEPGAGDGFGAALATFDGLLVVGAPFADEPAGGDVGRVYVFDVATGELHQTLRDPPQGVFDEFGFAVTGGAGRLLVGSPGASRVHVFDLAGLEPAPVKRRAFAASGTCPNGLVEGTEACDDGNDDDTDDCRNDCTASLCCTLDAVSDASARCDDGNPCTIDSVDEAIGCSYAPSGAPGCCATDADCPGGQCRLCLGCFIYEWDCCERGSRCVPSNPECAGETCIEAAYCQCGGKLACAGETVPEALRAVFDGACDTLRLQLSVAPEGTPTTDDLALARQMTKSARRALRRTIRTARALVRDGTISRECRREVVAQARVVKRAIPRGKRLRRCVLRSG